MKADWEDVLFEGRNKSYGAYVHHKIYGRHQMMGAVGGVLVFLLIIGYPAISSMMADNQEEKLISHEVVNLADVPPLNEKRDLPPPPPPPPVPPKPPLVQATIKFLPMRVREDIEVPDEETPPPVDKIDAAISNVTLKSGNKSSNLDVHLPPPAILTQPPPPAPDDKPKVSNEIKTIVEQYPEFPDGEAALFAWLRAHTKYPQQARDMGIEGTVYIAFVVERDGAISNVAVARGITGGGAGCNDEAIRVVSMMPAWKPGKQQGNPVRVSYTLPIKFRLKQ